LFIEGKPVFIIFRNVPYSITLDKENKKLTEKDKKFLRKLGYTESDIENMSNQLFLILKGYSASEIDAHTESIYIQRAFRVPMKNLEFYLYLIMTNIITALCVILFYSNYIAGLGD